MPDADKTLKINIEATDSASQVINKVASETEALSNTGKGLATGVPTLEEAVKKFTITTEAEYVAVAKAHAALTARIPVMQAAGKATDDMKAALANFDAALSTDQALQIAQRMEGKLWLEQKLAQIAAQEAATAATVRDTEANTTHAASVGLNAFQMRELVVVARELERGNFSRLPGSVARLATSFDLLGALFNPITIGLAGATAGFYLMYEAIEHAYDAAEKLGADFDVLNNILNGGEAMQAENDALREMAEKGDAAAESTTKLADASRDLQRVTEETNRSLSLQGRYEGEEIDARTKAAIAQVRAQVAAGKLTPAQGDQQIDALQNKAGKDRDAAESKTEQDQIDNLKRERSNQQALADDDAKKYWSAKQQADLDEVNAKQAKKEADQADKDYAAQKDKLAKEGPDMDADEYGRQLALTNQLGQLAIQKENAAGDAQTRANQSKADLDALTEAQKAATEAVKTLTEKIDSLTGDHAAADTHRQNMARYDQQTHDADATAKLEELTQKNIHLNKTIAKLFDVVQGGQQAMHDIVKYHIEHSTTLQAEVRALQNALSYLTGQNQNFRWQDNNG